MNLSLGLIDFQAMSALLIVLLGALVVLLIESFSSESSRKYASYISMFFLAGAILGAFFAPASSNPLLTPWLYFDSFSRFFTIFFLLIGLATTLLASSFFERFEASRGEFYFLLLAAIFGLILIGASADFLTLFLGIETLSIALYVLCGYMKKWELSQESSIKYFLIGAVAAAFLLYGIALIYGAVGTTGFAGLLGKYQAISTSTNKVLFLSGIALVTFGLAFKAAVVPFHVWAPDVYDGASNPVTAFMAVGTKTGAFAAFARLFLLVLPNFNPTWNEAIAILAFPTLIYANYVAIRQVQLRRFFAYSGISHAGFLLMPLAAGTPDSLQALVFYLIVYAFATLGCFGVLAYLDNRSNGVVVHDLSGLFRRSPLLATMFALCLLTLAGIPPTAGFLAKFFVFKVAYQAGFYTLVVVALLTTILSAYYYLRIISVVLSDKPEEADAPTSTWPATVVGLVCFVAIVALSFYPTPLLNLISVVK